MLNNISLDSYNISSDPGVTVYAQFLTSESDDDESFEEDNISYELLDPTKLDPFAISNELFNTSIDKLSKDKFPKGFDSFNFISEKRIGGGSFKKVYLANLLGPREKNVILLRSKKGHLKIQQRSRDIETLVAMVLLKDQDTAKKFFPKVYSVNESQIIVKYANCGEAKNVLPKLSPEEVRDVVSQIGKALIYLQSKGITHNDVALRNILIHKPKDNGPIKAYLTDNGCSVFNNEEISCDFPRPMDISAPECRSESNESTDAFSFGQLIADAFLRPGIDTSTSPVENPDYNKDALIRWQKRSNTFLKYNSAKARKNIASPSAIDDKDYQKLLEIDIRVANLAKNLMSYEPKNRPTLSNAVAILDSLTGMKS